jgi:methyl-accepting chemotaxis protein-1 (serine sensor receptor)
MAQPLAGLTRSSMKLFKKIPLAVGGAGALMFLAAALGLWAQWNLQQRYEHQVLAATRQSSEAQALLGSFKTQVQEWKNVLIRGKDAQALEAAWTRFQKEESNVQARARQLADAISPGEMRDQLESFINSHQKAGEAYRRGLESYKSSDFDPTFGDQAVKGVDRAPSELLNAVAARALSQADALSEDANADARRALLLTLSGLLVVMVMGLGMAWWTARQLKQMLGADPEQIEQAVRSIAAGDLASELGGPGAAPDGVMAALRDMQRKLSATLSGVRTSADSVATAASQIASGNQDLSGRTEQQAAALQRTASSMDQLGSTVRLNADNARQANQLAMSASSVAVEGGDVVAQVVDTMKGINDSSKRIADIIAVIDGIAFQTNILALNAAVEAARAGEQGRGFAVVAGEVRSLAQRSAEAAKEIKQLITDSVDRVEQGAALVDKAGHTMEEVVSSIKRVTDIMGEISAASVEQSDGVSQVGQAVAQMDQATQQNAALVEQSAAAAESLKQQALHLLAAVSTFQLGQSSDSFTLFDMDDTPSAPASQPPAPPKAVPAATLPKSHEEYASTSLQDAQPAPAAAESSTHQRGKPQPAPAAAAPALAASDDWETF